VKKCNRCGEVRALSAFNSHRWCKPCQATYGMEKKYYRSYRERRRRERERVKAFTPSSTHKWCRACNEVKAVAEFNKAAHKKDGLGTYCRQCSAEKQKRFFSADPKRTLEYQRRYINGNRSRVNAHNAVRKLWRRKLCVPPWADLQAIMAIYLEAERLTKQTGVPHEVDHIIPLKHPLVCGLHVASNLRVITEAENVRKRNSFAPEQFAA
jgi:hypothetical protein